MWCYVGKTLIRSDPLRARSALAFATLRSVSLTLSGHGVNAAYATLDAIFTTVLLIGDGVGQS
jgi:hypothetical protein